MLAKRTEILSFAINNAGAISAITRPVAIWPAPALRNAAVAGCNVLHFENVVRLGSAAGKGWGLIYGRFDACMTIGRASKSP